MVLETIGYIFCILFSAFIAFLLLAPLIRMIMGALSSTKTVTAVVEKKIRGTSFLKICWQWRKRKIYDCIFCRRHDKTFSGISVFL